MLAYLGSFQALYLNRKQSGNDKNPNDKSLIQATFYYRFYLNRAMVQSGMADLYYSQLTPWRDMLKMGLPPLLKNLSLPVQIVMPGVQVRFTISLHNLRNHA